MKMTIIDACFGYVYAPMKMDKWDVLFKVQMHSVGNEI